MSIAKTPQPPYYAVIFTSLRTENDKDYAETAAKSVELASQQDGFLGIESARDGLGITVSYWRDSESIRKWRAHAEHKSAQSAGCEIFYKAFATRVCRVERDHFFERTGRSKTGINLCLFAPLTLCARILFAKCSRNPNN